MAISPWQKLLGLLQFLGYDQFCVSEGLPSAAAVCLCACGGVALQTLHAGRGTKLPPQSAGLQYRWIFAWILLDQENSSHIHSLCGAVHSISRL